MPIHNASNPVSNTGYGLDQAAVIVGDGKTMPAKMPLSIVNDHEIHSFDGMSHQSEMTGCNIGRRHVKTLMNDRSLRCPKTTFEP
jgi:hypothetical protein